MSPFDYHRPDTVDGAVGLLATYGEDGKVLAGGQSLLPVLALRLTHGSGLEFEDRGAHELKGVPGEWRLFAVASS